MFTTPCFIRKNTAELRKKLEKLGYENRHLSMVTNVEEYPLLQVYRDAFYDGIIGDECGLEFYIDCGTNEELFIALAALRDDSDYMQWFINDYGYCNICYNKNVEDYKSGYGKQMYRIIDETYHKMSVEELIEHFNGK